MRILPFELKKDGENLTESQSSFAEPANASQALWTAEQDIPKKLKAVPFAPMS